MYFYQLFFEGSLEFCSISSSFVLGVLHVTIYLASFIWKKKKSSQNPNSGKKVWFLFSIL